MNEATVVEAFTKLGSAALLGLLLYIVLVKVGERVIRAIDKLADKVEANTAATTEVKVMLQQSARDRALGARHRTPPPGLDDTDDEGRR